MIAIIFSDGEVLKFKRAVITTECLNAYGTMGIKIRGYKECGEDFYDFYTFNQISAIIPIERR